MPTNRNALIRYKTIDNCLRNRQRKWTIHDLVDKCSEALYEYEGIDKGVSLRTVQVDIQTMRSEKLGYNAPIVVIDKKYYTYDDEEYSITNIPLTDHDINTLTEIVQLLKQFKDFCHFGELSAMVSKLEAQVYSQRNKISPVIDFEKNENLVGLEFLDPLYQAIINRKVISLFYQPFKAQSPIQLKLHPWLLKEFRNRWFLFGVPAERNKILNFPLDRIQHFEVLEGEEYHKKEEFDPSTYFNDIIGVTLNEKEPIHEIVLFIGSPTAPYVITKPLHHSQKVLEQTESGIVISLEVRLNFELERDIMAMGEQVTVISPPPFKERIRQRIQNSLNNYLNPEGD